MFRLDSFLAKIGIARGLELSTLKESVYFRYGLIVWLQSECRMLARTIEFRVNKPAKGKNKEMSQKSESAEKWVRKSESAEASAEKRECGKVRAEKQAEKWECERWDCGKASAKGESGKSKSVDGEGTEEWTILK